MKKNRAIFLDRDGTIINNIIIRGKSYPIRKKSDFKIKYGVINKLNFLAKFFHLIIVSNQPDYNNNGFYNLQNYIDNNIRKKIPKVDIEYFYGSKKNKKYYKPAPGMVLKYKKIYNLNLNKSYLIGDRWRDIGTAFNAGIKNSMLIYNKDYKENSFFYPPYFIFNNINQALKKIILLENLKMLTTN